MQLICSIISQGRIKEEINMSKIRTMKSVLAGMLAGTMVF